MNNRRYSLFSFRTADDLLSSNADMQAQFYPPVNYETDSGSWWIARGDVNGDTITDLATLIYHDITVPVLLGNGD